MTPLRAMKCWDNSPSTQSTDWGVREFGKRDRRAGPKDPPPPLTPKPLLAKMPNPFWDPPPAWSQNAGWRGTADGGPARSWSVELQVRSRKKKTGSLQIGLELRSRRPAGARLGALSGFTPDLATLVSEAAQKRGLALVHCTRPRCGPRLPC